MKKPYWISTWRLFVKEISSQRSLSMRKSRTKQGDEEMFEEIKEEIKRAKRLANRAKILAVIGLLLGLAGLILVILKGVK